MRISRITKIRKYRVFREFNWPADLHPFGQFNLIYGWNGSGKTTLAALLALLGKQVPIHEGEIEFEFDEATRVTGAGLKEAITPPIRVFNRDFIASTIQAAGSRMDPVYHLGEESVEKQKQVEELKLNFSRAQEQVTEAQLLRKVSGEKLDEFCINQAKVIKELLLGTHSTGYNNYDKRRYRQKVQGLSESSSQSALLPPEEKARLKLQKESLPKGLVERVALGTPDLDRIHAKVGALINKTIVSKALDALTSNPDVGTWVHHGLDLHSGKNLTDECRFCNQSLPTARRAALEAHFNDAFSAFQAEILEATQSLQRDRSRLSSPSVPDASRLYEHLKDDLTSGIESLSRELKFVTAFMEKVETALLQKKNAPFDVVAWPGEADEPTRPARDAIEKAVQAVNSIIEKHNSTTMEFKNQVDEACVKLEHSYVADTFMEFSRLRKEVEAAEAQLELIAGVPGQTQNQIEQIERDIVEHQRPAAELNAELRAYLGRDDLCFVVKDTGYTLSRLGQPVNHLSEGERTAIALLYFLKTLSDKSFDIAKGIVVIDDPVSSLDANALFSAFGYMKERTKAAGQLFVMTHNFDFFRQVKNWFHHLPGQNKRSLDRRPARFFLLRSCLDDKGQRKSALGPLDPLLEQYESEYHYLFKRVHEEVQRSAVDLPLVHHYNLPNIARRLLEAFLAFRLPDIPGDLAKRFEPIEFDAGKKTRILRLLNTYSHSNAIAEPDHDLSALSETKSVMRDVMEMIQVSDPTHYDRMVRLLEVGEEEAS